MDDRIPAHLEISGWIRAVQGEGGFAAVLAKGERDAGTILVICCENGANTKLYERMPQMDGSRAFVLTKEQDIEKPHEFTEYWQRRSSQDGDLWVVELDIADAERFIAATQHDD